MKTLTWFFTSNVGRAVLVAVLIMVSAGAIKLYYQQASVPASKRSAQATSVILQSAVQNLEAWHDARKDNTPQWPESTEWTPISLPCGRNVEVPPKERTHPTWATLKMDWEPPTSYQYRFSGNPDGFEMLARTDTDCDGIYHVVRIRGTVGPLGLRTDQLRHDNPNE